MSTMKFVVEDMLNGYIDAALWSSTDPETDKPFDDWATRSDLAKETIAKMKRDISKFVRANKNAVIDAVEYAFNHSHAARAHLYNMLGHDLWLTRNGHGTGFWDRDDYGPYGEALTSGAKKLGEVYLYRGDDGKIYQ